MSLERAYIVATERIENHPQFNEYLDAVIARVAHIAKEMTVPEVLAAGGMTAIENAAFVDVQESNERFQHATTAGFGQWVFDFAGVARRHKRQDIRISAKKAIRRIKRGEA